MADPQQKQIHIIGAGVSGLCAALTLEQCGYSPTVYEASVSVGGRVKTDEIEGYQLDHGFQVMIDAYPAAQKYLDYEVLQLQPLVPGAALFSNGRGHAFGDPLRDGKMLWSTLFSKSAGIADKWKIFQLSNTLKKKTLSAIFEQKETTTIDYLKTYGFSNKVIEQFFKPFFTGIFLETELTTSSRMFEFVYKMFAEGKAVIPKSGMQAIPQQLADKLTNTQLVLNEKVSKVTNEGVTLASGALLNSDFTIVATDPQPVLPNYHSTLKWKTCDCLYFEVTERTLSQPIIGLNTSGNALVNNIFFSTSIGTQSKGAGELLSATVVREHSFDPKELIEKVKAELANVFGIDDAKFLKHYPIPKSLPALNDLAYQRDPSESMLTEKIALAGDHLLNGSLNAAMLSGESAALAAHNALQKTL